VLFSRALALLRRFRESDRKPLIFIHIKTFAIFCVYECLSCRLVVVFRGASIFLQTGDAYDSSFDAYLTEVALNLGQKLQRESVIAQRQLPQANQRLDETKSRLAGTLFVARRTPPQSPIHAIARRIEKDVAISAAKAGDMDIAKDFATAAFARAQNYLPKNDNGAYNCPVCWVTEHLRVGLNSTHKSRNAETFECPSCAWTLTFRHQSDTKRRAPIAASRNRTLPG